MKLDWTEEKFLKIMRIRKMQARLAFFVSFKKTWLLPQVTPLIRN